MTNKKKIYIAGPMTGYTDYNFPAFLNAEKELSEKYEVLNPAKNPEQKCYADYIRAAIGLLIQCDAIFMLEKWELSKGSKLEWKIAGVLGMEIYFQSGENHE